MTPAKKGNIGMALFIGMIGLFFIAVIYFSFTGPYQTIMTTFNDSYTRSADYDAVTNINMTWRWSFIILGLAIILYVVISALKKQPGEYYL